VSEPTFDMHVPSPDVGHEAIRLAVLQAIADGQTNAGGVDDTYFLTDLLFSLLDSAFASIDDLTARVAALEANP